MATFEETNLQIEAQQSISQSNPQPFEPLPYATTKKPAISKIQKCSNMKAAAFQNTHGQRFDAYSSERRPHT